MYILAELVNMCLKKSCFPIAGRSHQWSLYLRMLEKGLQLKTATLVVFLWLVKSVVRNVTFFLIASMVLGLLDQQWIFGQCVIELLGLLINRSGDTGALDIAKAFF